MCIFSSDPSSIRERFCSLRYPLISCVALANSHSRNLRPFLWGILSNRLWAGTCALAMKLEGSKSLERMNAYGKRQCMSLFWRVRAALKKAIKNGSKRQLKFQYDPSSYALNFDDGHSKISEVIHDASKYELQNCGNVYNSAMWVYVLWVKSE